MSDLLFPIISMVLLVLAEAGVLQFTGRQKVDWLDVIFNINSGHTDAVVISLPGSALLWPGDQSLQPWTV